MEPSARRSAQPHAQRPYCLACYAPMPRTHDVSAECDHCGFQNLRIDQDIYWTREPWLRRIELVAKALVSLFVGWITYELLFSFDGGYGVPQGVAIGAPILIAVVLWDTVSKITRKNPYFNAGLFWSVLPAVVGAPILLLGLWGLARPIEVWPPETHQEMTAARAVLFVLLVGALLLGVALASRLFGRRLRAWQERRVIQGQERALRGDVATRYPLRP